MRRATTTLEDTETGIFVQDLMQPIRQDFYLRPALRVAPELLGCVLVRRYRRSTVIGRIVEVEAYTQHDSASHSFRGRTSRNEVMFGSGGRLYVYFTYGMHFCANVVTGEAGSGEAVLIRAVEPMSGLEHMAIRRYGTKKLHSRGEVLNLARGPARLCEAFHILRQDNGTLLSGDRISITRPPSGGRIRTARSQRIGIRDGHEKKWRFYVQNCEWVSRRDVT